MPSKKETLTVIVIMALFLLLTAACIGLRSEHLLMAALYLVLFFAGLPTRKLAVALLPFAIFGISYVGIASKMPRSHSCDTSTK
mgnify:CR=1 FL=1